MAEASASMQHTEATIRLLSRTQYRIFCFGRRAVQALCGLILILLSLRGQGSIMTVLCLFAGCWLCMNTDVPAKVRAGKVIDSMQGRFPLTRYTFYGEAFTLIAGDKQERIAYTSLIRLVEDDAYLYLYISKLSAYMVDKATASPDVQTIRRLVGDGSGLRWTRPTSLVNFSLRTLLARRRRS